MPTEVLLVAATERELSGHAGVACGIGPVEAAAAAARALALERPDAVLHVGIAGGRGLEPGTLVVGTESVYLDIAAGIPVISRVEPDARLLAAVRTAFPDASALPIATSAAVDDKRVTVTSGDSHLQVATSAVVDDKRVPGPFGAGHLVEAMEGFAVLRACALAGVPAVEVRVVSNEIGEPDRGLWEIQRALDVLAGALPKLLATVGQ